MNLKPQDILFLLKLVAIGKNPWSFNKIAVELGMSPSEVHGAAQRALAASLAVKSGSNIVPNTRNLQEFLEYGIQYAFVPERGAVTRGMPTGYAVAALNDYVADAVDMPSVWPVPEGQVNGEAFSPLYKSVPVAAKNDPALYRLLALVDAVRGGCAEERELAKKALATLLNPEKVENRAVKNRKNKTLVIGGQLEISSAALQKLAQRFHIRRLSLFGSAARGELKLGSDIDLLVEFESEHTPSMAGMVEIHDAFETLFKGYKVDLATPSIMNNPYRRKSIEKDLEELYAA